MNKIKEKNINYQFLILETVGIILVVLGHGKSAGIQLFTDWFPSYSFHMPLFIFISGYFYNKERELNYTKFILIKFKRLIIPYFIWNLIYGIIISILKYNNIISFGNMISFTTLFISPWKSGHQFIFNLASWFVIELFIIQVVYVLFRKLYILKNEYILMIILMIIGCFGVIISIKGYNTEWYLPLVRTMFLIPFFHIGHLYKEKLEQKDTINSAIYFLIIFVIQFFLIVKYNGKLTLDAAFCTGFNKENVLLPYMTSITGIMFWLRISKILVPSLGKSKIINNIGSNTWSIMMHHLFIFFIINSFFALVAQSFKLNGFNYEFYKAKIFYAYIPGGSLFQLFYVISGVSVPVIIKVYVMKIKGKCTPKCRDNLRPMSRTI